MAQTATQIFSRNEVIFMGRLGKDPEMSYTQSGKALTKFSLAVNQGRDKDAMWLTVTCWQELAEEVNEKATKGALVEVRGRLSQNKFKDRYYYEVTATSVEVINTEKKKTTKTTAQSDLDPSDLDGMELEDHPF